jgi:hypothetical protein
MSFKVMPDATGNFQASIKISVGDGAHILLWEDPWINDMCADTVSLAILPLVEPRFRRKMTVQDGCWATLGP